MNFNDIKNIFKNLLVIKRNLLLIKRINSNNKLGNSRIQDLVTEYEENKKLLEPYNRMFNINEKTFCDLLSKELNKDSKKIYTCDFELEAIRCDKNNYIYTYNIYVTDNNFKKDYLLKNCCYTSKYKLDRELFKCFKISSFDQDFNLDSIIDLLIDEDNEIVNYSLVWKIIEENLKIIREQLIKDNADRIKKQKILLDKLQETQIQLDNMDIEETINRL